VIEPISLQHGYRSSHGLLKVESITREWNGVSVTYNAKYPGPGVAYADLSSEKTTVVVCLEQKGGMCEPRLKVDEATPRTRYDMGYFIWIPANHTVWGYADSVQFVRDITLKFDLDHMMNLLGRDRDYSHLHEPLLMVYDSKVTQCAHLLVDACVDTWLLQRRVQEAQELLKKRTSPFRTLRSRLVSPTKATSPKPSNASQERLLAIGSRRIIHESCWFEALHLVH
jgi:hypothetical protein